MGHNVKFQSDAHTCDGFLSLPKEKGPAVVVIQEWWGLVPHIEHQHAERRQLACRRHPRRAGADHDHVMQGDASAPATTP